MSNLYRAWVNDKPLTGKRAKSFIDYSIQNQRYLIPIGNYVFDGLSLRSRVCLSQCTNCLKYQECDCCVNRNFGLVKENIEALKPHVEAILKSIPRENNLVDDRLDSFYRYGAFSYKDAILQRGHESNKCLFSMRDGEQSKCAIHYWCEKNGLDVFKYKPYACSLFPIEGIRLTNGRIFVFCPTRETDAFTMYFYTDTRRVCINEYNMSRVVSNSIGGHKYLNTVNRDNVLLDKLYPDLYSTVYRECEKVLRYFCGDSTYERLVTVIETF